MKGKKQTGSFNLSGSRVLDGLLSNPISVSSLQNKAEHNAEPSEDASEWIEIDKIVRSPFQPRQFFSEESINSLARAFEKQGFKGAINVRKKADDVYELVAGERRWRAAAVAKLDKVRCLVDEYTDEEALEFALMENLQREDLSKLEETEGILRFLSIKLGIDQDEIIRVIKTEGHSDRTTRSDVAPSEEIVNIEALLSVFNVGLQTFRTKNLRTLSLPEDIKTAHLEQNLSYSTAIELSKIKDKSARKKLLAEASQANLSFRTIKEKVKSIKLKSEKKPNEASFALIERFSEISRKARKYQSSAIELHKRKRMEALLDELEDLLAND